MENNLNQRLPNNIALYTGKMDHSTALVFLVANKREQIKESMEIIQMIRIFSQIKETRQKILKVLINF